MATRLSSPAIPLALALLAACTPTGGDPGRGQAEPDPALPPTTFDADPGRSMVEWRAAPDELTTAPVSLTASDGTGLQLTAMDAKVVLEDPLAFTELTLSFRNPEDRVREGHFEINLPTGAAISRFAMLIDGEWQEAEVVERQAARVAYEDFLHRKQDPALLEQKAGNQFRARVFPIPAKGTKQLKIAYSQELRSAKQPYVLPLAGLPRMGQLDVDVTVVEPAAGLVTLAKATQRLEVHERDFAPRADLEVRFERAVVERGLRSDGLAVARVAPVLDSAPEPIRGLTVLFDSSASRALGYAGQVDRLAALIDRLAEDADFPIEVLAFDQELVSIYRGSAIGFASEGKALLRARAPLGASDLAGALTRLAAREVHPRVLVVSDGIVTAGDEGDDSLADLRRAVAALAELGVERVDALVDGGIQDELTLAALTSAGLERDGVVASGRLTTQALAHKLTRTTRSGVEVTVPGAQWVWPRVIDGVQPGDEVLVYAQLDADTPMTVELRHGGELREVGVETRPAQGPLLQRAWVRAKIDQLSASYRSLAPSDAKQTLRDEIIALSTRERVLSEHTALLVLETDADYDRFGIDRTALSDILVVGPAGVELRDRSAPLALAAKPEEEEQDAQDRWREGTRHRGEEGKMGRPTSRSKSGLYAMRGPSEAIPQLARNFDPDASAREAGVLGTSPEGGAFAVGNDDADVWGGLTGTEVGEAYGVGGLGLVGSGRGGGGTGSGYGRGSGAGFGGRGQRVPEVRVAQAEVSGALDRDLIRRIVRAHTNEVRSCYHSGLTRDPSLAGRVVIDFVINGSGKVSSSLVQESSVADEAVAKCIAKAVKRWTFPKPTGGGIVTVTYPFVLSPGGSGSGSVGGASEPAKPPTQNPWTGRFAEIMGRLADREVELALSEAWQWRESEPGSELALLALGEAAEASGDLRLAARAYGSLIDLFPSRADIRRMAGQRLERVAQRGQERNEAEAAAAALALAVDTYREAVEQRPDHPSSHRLYAYTLLKAGHHERAFDAIMAGVTRSYPLGRFAGVDEILGEDAGLIAAAWIAASPKDEPRIRARLAERDLPVATGASTRFVINWETDANDVDFHIYDGRGGHAYYADKQLASGGHLFADVTTGYGPECFKIEGTPDAGPYTLQAHYYAMGPMGYGMGKLEILRHDGKGGLRFDERPFVIMRDRAFVDLGKVRG